MTKTVQSEFYGEWNADQQAKRMAAQAKAYRKAGINPRKAKRGHGSVPE